MKNWRVCYHKCCAVWKVKSEQLHAPTHCSLYFTSCQAEHARQSWTLSRINHYRCSNTPRVSGVVFSNKKKALAQPMEVYGRGPLFQTVAPGWKPRHILIGRTSRTHRCTQRSNSAPRPSSRYTSCPANSTHNHHLNHHHELCQPCQETPRVSCECQLGRHGWQARYCNTCPSQCCRSPRCIHTCPPGQSASCFKFACARVRACVCAECEVLRGAHLNL